MGVGGKRARLEARILEGSGVTDPALRRAAAAGAAPTTALAAYVATVHRAAHEVTDEQVASLRAAGWADDPLFEVTVAAALGAARRRLEAGLRALAAAEEA